MKIKEITSQHGRDFTALFECEHCGHTYRSYGYDDDNFHRNIVPDMECPICKKKASKSYRHLGTKYRGEEMNRKERSRDYAVIIVIATITLLVTLTGALLKKRIKKER